MAYDKFWPHPRREIASIPEEFFSSLKRHIVELSGMDTCQLGFCASSSLFFSLCILFPLVIFFLRCCSAEDSSFLFRWPYGRAYPHHWREGKPAGCSSGAEANNQAPGDGFPACLVWFDRLLFHGKGMKSCCSFNVAGIRRHVLMADHRILTL